MLPNLNTKVPIPTHIYLYATPMANLNSPPPLRYWPLSAVYDYSSLPVTDAVSSRRRCPRRRRPCPLFSVGSGWARRNSKRRGGLPLPIPARRRGRTPLPRCSFSLSQLHPPPTNLQNSCFGKRVPPDSPIPHPRHMSGESTLSDQPLRPRIADGPPRERALYRPLVGGGGANSILARRRKSSPNSYFHRKRRLCTLLQADCPRWMYRQPNRRSRGHLMNRVNRIPLVVRRDQPTRQCVHIAAQRSDLPTHSSVHPCLVWEKCDYSRKNVHPTTARIV